MISSMASISSSSSASVRVEKATSEFLIGPDWTLNIDICDAINSNQMLAKDAVKAVKKRLQHKNPKVQLLALTLLETMVKNCGDYVHFQIAEKNIPQEMVKIVRKKTDLHVRDKVLTLIASWHQAFGGFRGRYPQYHLAYEELRADGVEFPRQPDAAPIFTPPVTHPIPRHPQPGYGMPSSSSTRLDEAMAAEENLSLSSLTSMHDVLDLLMDMLQAVDPNDRSAVKDEVIIDLVEQCRANQRKLMQLLGTTGDEELLGKGLELNDSIQSVLAKHDAIASGSPLPPEVKKITSGESEKHDSSLKSAEVTMPNATSNGTPAAPTVPAHKRLVDEEDEEEDDFAQLARRHSKNHTDASQNTAMVKSDAVPPEAPPSPAMSNALVPIDAPASVRSKDQDIIDLLSMTLSTVTSTEQTSQAQATTPQHTPGHVPSTTPGTSFASEAYPGSPSLPFNNYVAPWAQPQPQPSLQPQPQHQPQPPYQHQPHTRYQHQPQPQPQPQPQLSPEPQAAQQAQHQPQYQSLSLPASHPQAQFPQYASAYPPPPWAPTPGYFTNQNSVSRPYYTYSAPRPTSSSNPRPLQYESINGEAQINSSPMPTAANSGPKPFIPSYRLFEDLNVFGNTDGRFKATGNASPSLAGSNNQNMVGGRK